jgi:hypothetical protein
LTFKKWVEKIQPAGYNGARTVFISNVCCKMCVCTMSHFVVAHSSGTEA